MLPSVQAWAALWEHRGGTYLGQVNGCLSYNVHALTCVFLLAPESPVFYGCEYHPPRLLQLLSSSQSELSGCLELFLGQCSLHIPVLAFTGKVLPVVTGLSAA